VTPSFLGVYGNSGGLLLGLVFPDRSERSVFSVSCQGVHRLVSLPPIPRQAVPLFLRVVLPILLTFILSPRPLVFGSLRFLHFPCISSQLTCVFFAFEAPVPRIGVPPRFVEFFFFFYFFFFSLFPEACFGWENFLLVVYPGFFSPFSALLKPSPSLGFKCCVFLQVSKGMSVDGGAFWRAFGGASSF